MDGDRRIATADILSIGSELLVGETRDTNSGDIARALAERGVTVRRIVALPDELDAVRSAFASGLAAVDLVVSTGGLGPTPDDLTREGIAAALGEEPAVDREIDAWLRGLWARRGLPYPEINRKQAWLIPSATAIPNRNGTAPGWWVERPTGAIVVALPGPPREMRPMWEGWVLQRLGSAGLGVPRVVRTLRLSGIGESQVADRLGEPILRATNPLVATYARADAVDIRISAVDEEPGRGGRSATELGDDAEAAILAALGDHVWARGQTTWPEAIDAELARHGWHLAVIEAGTGGSVTALLGTMERLRDSTLRGAAGTGEGSEGSERRGAAADQAVAGIARAAVDEAPATDAPLVGLAVVAREVRGDLSVRVAVASPHGEHVERRTAFLAGPQGRARAALAAADVLLRRLRAEHAAD